MRVAAIIRVSDPRQAAKDKTSLDDQRKAIRHACGPDGLNIGELVAWYEDQESAYKGKVGGDKPREQFEQMLLDAQAGRFDTVMVAHRSRWARNGEDSARAVRIFNSCRPRIKFFFLTERVNIHLATGRTLLGITAAMSEGEVAQFREGVMRAKHTRVTQGKHPYGAKSFGRKRDKSIIDNKVVIGPWEPDPKEIALYERFYVYVVERGISGRKAAAKIGHGTLTAWLNRIDNAGDSMMLYPEDVDTGMKKPIPIKVPRIWSDAKIARVKKALAENRKRSMRSEYTAESGRTRAYSSPLAGKVRCPCGSVMWSAFRNGQRKFIHPGDTKNRVPGIKCVSSIVAPPFEKKAYIKLGTLFDRRKAEQAFRAGVDQRKEQDLAARRKELAKRQEALAKEQGKFLDAIGKLPEGPMRGAARKKVEDLDAEANALASELQELEQDALAYQVEGDAAAWAAQRLAHMFREEGTAQIEEWSPMTQKELVDILAKTRGSLAPFGPKGHSKEKEKRGIYIGFDKNGEPEPMIEKFTVDQETLVEIARRIVPTLVRPRLYKEKRSKGRHAKKVVASHIPTRFCIAQGCRRSP
jgi:DNA invertase Pin-like site-specific DNA recombinase